MSISILALVILMPGCSSVDHAPDLSTTGTPASLTATTLAPQWTEYELALTKAFLPDGVSGLCEWDILGEREKEVYVWALCAGNSRVGHETVMIATAPAIIYLGADGHVQSARVPRDGTLYARDIKTLFPPDVQNEVFAYRLESDMRIHIDKRLADPRIPPLIVVSGTLAP